MSQPMQVVNQHVRILATSQQLLLTTPRMRALLVRRMSRPKQEMLATARAVEPSRLNNVERRYRAQAKQMEQGAPEP